MAGRARQPAARCGRDRVGLPALGAARERTLRDGPGMEGRRREAGVQARAVARRAGGLRAGERRAIEETDVGRTSRVPGAARLAGTGRPDRRTVARSPGGRGPSGEGLWGGDHWSGHRSDGSRLDVGRSGGRHPDVGLWAGRSGEPTVASAALPDRTRIPGARRPNPATPGTAGGRHGRQRRTSAGVARATGRRRACAAGAGSRA